MNLVFPKSNLQHFFHKLANFTKLSKPTKNNLI